MTYPEWIAGAATLVVAVLVSIAVDPAVGFAAGLVAFPLMTRIAGHSTSGQRGSRAAERAPSTPSG